MISSKSVLIMSGRFLNDFVSFIVFSLLDAVDFILCYVYKIIDFFIEADWKPCYCSSAKEAITSSGKILVSERGESNKIVCLTSSKLQLEEISDTLYTRSSLVSEISKSTVNELKRFKIETTAATVCEKTTTAAGRKGTVRSTFTVNSTIVEMLQGKIGGGQQSSHPPVPRWSDCDCTTCNSWTKESLYVKAEGATTGNFLILPHLLFFNFLSYSLILPCFFFP